ncbi:TPA: site-specific integrase [Clostridium botulinum]|nr:site-specific integrase [Clostridium botulinum]HBJ1655887.1 site-specific integrase [Clostridium botulinum]
MARKTNRVLQTTEEDILKILPENLELIEDFINYLETTDHSQKSIVVYKNNLHIFFIYLMKKEKNIDFCNIKKRHILNFQNYMVKNNLSSARIRNVKSSLSSLSNFIESMLSDEEEKWENFRNIINKIPNPTLNTVREKTVLSDAQLENLLDKLVEMGKIQIATFVAFSAFSGTRKAETIQYKRSWFTKETCKNGLYITPEIRTKGHGSLGKMLVKYALKSKVDKYLELWDKEREEKGIDIDDLFVVKSKGEWTPAKISTVDSWMETCSKILGQPSYAHMYRHFFVSYLRRESVPISIIKDIVGHEDVNMSERYNDNPKEDEFLKYFSENGINKIKEKGLSDL